jgi:prepilin-type processing-associated H-X9-DG protein
MKSPQTSNLGYTLVELAVSMTVLVCMGGLICIQLNRTRTGSQQQGCWANLKQLQSGLQLYVTENEGRLPFTIEAQTYGYWQSIRGSWVLGNAQMDVGAHWITNGELWPYVNSLPAYRCPAYQSTFKTAPSKQRLRSYGINQFFNHKTTSGSNTQVGPGKIDRIDGVQTDEIYSFIGVDESTIDSGIFSIRYNLWEKDIRLAGWYTFPSERHSRGANLSFLDGHVEHHQWEHAPKHKHYSQWKTVAVNQQDLNDMTWIFNRTPWKDWIPPKDTD